MKNQLTKIVLLAGVVGVATLVGSSKPAKADSFYVGGRGFSLGFSDGPTYVPRYYAPRYVAPNPYTVPYAAYGAPYYGYGYGYAAPYAPAYGGYDWRDHGDFEHRDFHDYHGRDNRGGDFRGGDFRTRDNRGGDFRGTPQRHEFGR